MVGASAAYVVETQGMLLHHNNASVLITAATLDFLIVSRKQRDSGRSSALLTRPGSVWLVPVAIPRL